MSEACARLGCTPRQLRYRIKKGELPARKVDGRWHIDERVLPRTPGRDRAELEREADLKEVVAQALAKRRAHRRDSVEDLQVFAVLVAGVRALRARTPAHPALPSLVEAAAALARGVHSYGANDKTEAFRAARRHVATGVAWLHVEPEPQLAHALEEEVLPGIGGLLRRLSRKRREA